MGGVKMLHARALRGQTRTTKGTPTAAVAQDPVSSADLPPPPDVKELPLEENSELNDASEL